MRTRRKFTSEFKSRVIAKRIQWLMQQMGLQRPVKKRKTRTTDSDRPFPSYPNLVKGEPAKQPNAIWVADITYVHLEHEFV